MPDSNDLVFEIVDGGNLVRLDAMKLLYADSPGSQRWIGTNVSVRGGAFSGQYNTEFELSNFSSFRDQLASLYTDLKGQRRFYGIEGQLDLMISGDGLGHFGVDVTANERSDAEATLEFKISFDQTMLPGIVKQLDEIIEHFSASP